MKHALSLLAIPLLLSTSALAQSGSGSGNGNGNRDVLDYQSELRQSDLSIQSFDEALQKLRDGLVALASERMPQFNGPEQQFWNQLTDQGRKAAADFDQYLIKALQTPIHLTNSARASIRAALATVDATVRDQQQYADRGYAKNLKNVIAEARKNISNDAQRQMTEIVHSLFNVLSERKRVNQYQSNWTDGYRVNQYFSNCDTAPCIDLINKRAMDYLDFVKVSLETNIQILSKSDSLAGWHNTFLRKQGTGNHNGNRRYVDPYCEQKAGKRLSSVFDAVSASRFSVMYAKNQQAIKAANNPPPQP